MFSVIAAVICSQLSGADAIFVEFSPGGILRKANLTKSRQEPTVGHGESIAQRDKLAPATFVLTGVPYTKPTQNVARTAGGVLDKYDWPADYCFDFDVTFPTTFGSPKSSGYAGAIALLGSVYITMSKGPYVAKGAAKGAASASDGLAMMAIVQSDGHGPYFATPIVGKKGSRHQGLFCYKQSTKGKPYWVVDGARVAADYIHNANAAYPTTRDVKVSALAALHRGKHHEDMVDGKLSSFKITHWFASPPFRLLGTPYKSKKANVATLSKESWPTDYCINFDITLPPTVNAAKNSYGYEGGIVSLGKLWIGVVHTSKLYPRSAKGNKDSSDFGFLALISGDGYGPYWGTAGVAKVESRHKASFCYKQAEKKPSWNVDGAEAEAGYLYKEGKGKAFPTEKDVSVNIMTSHELVGATLHSLEIASYDEQRANPVSYGYPYM